MNYSHGLGSDHHAEGKKRDTAGNLLYAASIIFLVSIPIVILLMLALVNRIVGYQVSFGRFFEAIGSDPSLSALFCSGILMQIAFAFVSIFVGRSIKTDADWAPWAAVAVGVVAIVMSLLLFGGIVASIGGVLMVVGGGLALSAKKPVYVPIRYPPAYIVTGSPVTLSGLPASQSTSPAVNILARTATTAHLRVVFPSPVSHVLEARYETMFGRVFVTLDGSEIVAARVWGAQKVFEIPMMNHPAGSVSVRFYGIPSPRIEVSVSGTVIASC